MGKNVDSKTNKTALQKNERSKVPRRYIISGMTALGSLCAICGFSAIRSAGEFDIISFWGVLFLFGTGFVIASLGLAIQDVMHAFQTIPLKKHEARATAKKPVIEKTPKPMPRQDISRNATFKQKHINVKKPTKSWRVYAAEWRETLSFSNLKNKGMNLLRSAMKKIANQVVSLNKKSVPSVLEDLKTSPAQPKIKNSTIALKKKSKKKDESNVVMSEKHVNVSTTKNEENPCVEEKKEALQEVKDESHVADNSSTLSIATSLQQATMSELSTSSESQSQQSVGDFLAASASLSPQMESKQAEDMKAQQEQIKILESKVESLQAQLEKSKEKDAKSQAKLAKLQGKCTESLKQLAQKATVDSSKSEKLEKLEQLEKKLFSVIQSSNMSLDPEKYIPLFEKLLNTSRAMYTSAVLEKESRGAIPKGYSYKQYLQTATNELLAEINKVVDHSSHHMSSRYS